MCVCIYICACVYVNIRRLRICPLCNAKKPTYEKVVRRIRPEDVNSTLIFGETMHHQKTLHKDDADSTRVPSCLRLHPPPRLSLPPFIELSSFFFLFLVRSFSFYFSLRQRNVNFTMKVLFSLDFNSFKLFILIHLLR